MYQTKTGNKKLPRPGWTGSGDPGECPGSNDVTPLSACALQAQSATLTPNGVPGSATTLLCCSSVLSSPLATFSIWVPSPERGFPVERFALSDEACLF